MNERDIERARAAETLMNEREIERAAAELGSDVYIDVEQTAQRVVARLREAPPRAAWWQGRAALRAAAAVAVLVTGGVLVARAIDSSAAGDGAIALPVGLEELSPTGLTEVLDSLDLFSPASEFIPSSFNELDEEQLRTLLAAMEG